MGWVNPPSDSRWTDPDDLPPVPDNPGLALGDLLCDATDELRDAIDAEAEAEVAYRRAWSLAYLYEEVPATARDKWAQAQADEQNAVWIFAKARTKRAVARCEMLRARLSAWQTYVRREADVT